MNIKEAVEMIWSNTTVVWACQSGLHNGPQKFKTRKSLTHTTGQSEG
jgi:hypothetical protein